MSYNQYVSIPPEIVGKLPFLGQPFYYLFKDSAGKTLRGILYEITEDNMGKAHKRLTGEKGEIVSGDKVYVLPNCRIPMYKLSHYLKEAGARQTADVTEATKIIGHERTREDVKRQALGSTMLLYVDAPWYQSEYKNKYYGKQEDWDTDRKLFEEAVSSYKDAFTGEFGECKTLVSQTIWVNSFNFPNSGQGFRPGRFITPTGAWILYNHLLNKIPVINEDEIYEKIGKPTVLDERSYQVIYDMLGSQDEDNQKMGSELLANCDINPSLYWIWKLADQFYGTVLRSSRFKNIRLFVRMSNWGLLAGMKAEEFIRYMFRKGLLTKEYFAELVKEAAMPYANKLNSDLFSVVMIPSKKYEEYAEGQRFEFNREPESEEVEVEEEECEEED